MRFSRAICCAVGLVLVCRAVSDAAAPLSFRHVYIDQQAPPTIHIKSFGHFDHDGFADLLVAGTNGQIYLYDYPTWTRRVVATGGGGWSIDAECGDIDGDGDEDIVISDQLQNARLVWFENVDGRGETWTMHVIGQPWAHDVDLADLDNDGRLDIVTRRYSDGPGAADVVELWRNGDDGAWQHRTIPLATAVGGEGQALGDINGDDLIDIVTPRHWYRNPGDVMTATWPAFQYAAAYDWPHSNIAIGDLNGDGRSDIALTPAAHANEMYRTSWFEGPEDATGLWTEHIVENGIEAVTHSLAIADMDRDGRMDLVTAEMHDGANPDEIRIYSNDSGDGLHFSRHVVATTGSHSLRLVDVDNDGDMDIFGANWSGNGRVSVFLNDSHRGFVLRCDLNADGSIDSRDIDRFSAVLLGGAGTGQELCAGDVGGAADGLIGMEDIEPFVACLLYSSAPAACIRGDINGDSAIDGRDLSRFSELLAGGEGWPCEHCAGDVEATPDGWIDLDDVENFVVMLLDTPGPTPGCTANGSAWGNISFAAQTGNFIASYDVVPGAAVVDAVTGLSAAPASSLGDLAVAVRFGPSGTIEARDGEDFSATTTMYYVPGERHRVRLVVDLMAKTFDVGVTPPGGTEQLVGAAYSFNATGIDTNNLKNLGMVSTQGTQEVCDLFLPPGLQVTPTEEAHFACMTGELFAPPLFAYTLRNVSTSPVSWLATTSQWWVNLSATQGTLEPGDSTSVTVNVNSALSNVSSGNFFSELQFTNLSTDIGTTSRRVMASVNAVSRHGITWNFNHPYQVGQFVNGDWWVVGPVTVASVVPAPGGGRNGSMINTPVNMQAYDGRIVNYNSQLGAVFPVTLQPGDCLLSTQSLESESICDVTGYCPLSGHAFLRRAAVLTVVSSPPAADAFRPPYIGATRPIFTSSQLHRDLLPRLAFASKPDISYYERVFARLWVENLGSDWQGRPSHPVENMPNYGREIGMMVSEAGLVLMMDYSDAELDQLLIPFVQYGIDLYYITEAGAEFWGDGGHGNGRKWPIVFAGLMLDHDGMKNVSGPFGEDDQTYMGASGRGLFGRNCTSPYQANGCSGEGAKDCRDPAGLVDGCPDYRNCCTSETWVGQALSAHLMGATNFWNHPAFFDYVDRWMAGDVEGGGAVGSLFVRNMWDLYR